MLRIANDDATRRNRLCYSLTIRSETERWANCRDMIVRLILTNQPRGTQHLLPHLPNAGLRDHQIVWDVK
jgi:hypothetical protein